MHAKPDLRVVLKWMIACPGSGDRDCYLALNIACQYLNHLLLNIASRRLVKFDLGRLVKSKRHVFRIRDCLTIMWER